MRNIKAPNANSREGSSQGPCLNHFFELWLIGKFHFNFFGLQGVSIGKGHAVPLVQSVCDYFVANLLETSYRELLRLAFDFLHCQHINLGALKKLNNPLSSGSCGVYVPGGYLHF